MCRRGQLCAVYRGWTRSWRKSNRLLALWVTLSWAARWKEPLWPYAETLCSPPRSTHTETDRNKHTVWSVESGIIIVYRIWTYRTVLELLSACLHWVCMCRITDQIVISIWNGGWRQKWTVINYTAIKWAVSGTLVSSVLSVESYILSSV